MASERAIEARIALVSLALIAVSLTVLICFVAGARKKEHDPPGTYLCHTYATWNERNYAEFTVERDGKTVACLQASN